MTDQQKVLSLMLEKFQEKHGRQPIKIVVAPVALVALGLKQSVGPIWNGTTVECRLFTKEEVVSKQNGHEAVSLGVFVKERRRRMVLIACDLRNLPIT